MGVILFGNRIVSNRLGNWGSVSTPVSVSIPQEGGGGDPGGGGNQSASAAGDLYLANVTGSEVWLRVQPSMFPSGNFTNDQFVSNTLFTTERKFITSTDRWWHEEVTTPIGTVDALRFRDPSLDSGSNTNPWFRRWHPQFNWGESNMLDMVPGSSSAVYDQAFMQLKLYYPTASFQKKGFQGWSPGKHIKHWGGVDLGGVGATGGNPQTDGVFEGVFTSYGMRTLENGFNAKGDFPGATQRVAGSSGTFDTVPDISGVYGPSALASNSESYLNLWHNGIGIYAHDNRLSFNFEEMIYPCYEGTNVRYTFQVGHVYEHRIWFKMNTPGEYDGELQWWMKVDNGDFFLARHLNDIDWRGNSSEGFKGDGFIFFCGGFGGGWSWGDSNYHPAGPKLDRQLYILGKETRLK